MSVFAAIIAIAGIASADAEWQTLAPGAQQTAIAHDDARITVLRFDPREWQLRFASMADTADKQPHTAREWARREGFAAAINAGMFRRDFATHIGYLKSGSRVYNGRSNDYQSIAAFDPLDAQSPPFRMFDLDAGTTLLEILQHYGSAMQNLRLIKRPGENPWPQQARRWSEAALGEDAAGNILFIFCRTPLSMQDFNAALLASDIHVVAAQHLEGGAEAQLYLHIGDVEREWVGSHAAQPGNDDAPAIAWAIPNVLGVKRKND